MVDHDRLFKELLTTFFDDFLALFAPQLAARVTLDGVLHLDKELYSDVLRGERYEVDVLARVRLQGDEPSFVLVHVENQARAERHFAQRMFRYYSALTLNYAEPIYPIALLSYDAPGRPEPRSYSVRLPGLDVLRFNFECVQLNRLSWRAFMKKPNPVAAALMSRMRVGQEERLLVKAACLRMLAGLKLDLASSMVVTRFVDAYLRLNDQEESMLREELASSPDGEKIMEYITSWEEKAIKQGREEGMARGREAEALRIVVALLRRRVGPLPSTVESRVGSLSLPDLEALSESLLDLTSISELETWLSAR